MEANKSTVNDLIEKSMSLSEWVDKAKEVNRFLEEVDKYIEKSNLIIRNLNQVIHL